MRGRRTAVFIIFFMVLFFLSMIPVVIGGEFQAFYNNSIECALFFILSDKFVDWIFGKRKNEKD